MTPQLIARPQKHACSNALDAMANISHYSYM
jgi:hypothetical protein